MDERQLAVEGAGRRRVAACALLAGLAYFAGETWNAIVSAKDPNVGLLQGLAPAFAGKAAAKVDPRTIHEHFLIHYQWPLIVGLVLTGIGAAAMTVPLRYLSAAENLRSATPSSVVPYIATFAPLLLAIFLPVYEISLIVGAHSYLSGAARTSSALTSATGGTWRTVIVLIVTLGTLALAAAWILVSLRSMRVGLLTRVMGGFGILGGILFVIPLTPLPVVQALWMVFFAAMLLEFARRPLPVAWTVAEARPWPSPPPRERRAAQSRRGLRRSPAPPPPAPAPAMPRGGPSPSASKKRKRRH